MEEGEVMEIMAGEEETEEMGGTVEEMKEEVVVVMAEMAEVMVEEEVGEMEEEVVVEAAVELEGGSELDPQWPFLSTQGCDESSECARKVSD